MANPDWKPIALASLAVCLTLDSSCVRGKHGNSSVVQASSSGPVVSLERPESKSMVELSVEPQVQSEIQEMEGERRAALVRDAELAIAETRNAMAALSQGDTSAAKSALERASASLRIVVSRDPSLAFAPVDVSTSIIDLYASPDTVKRAVNEARKELGSAQVQQARRLMSSLASEADIHVVGIPLGTYPDAIRAAVPLIDAGRPDEAKAALGAALHTLVIQTYVIPLPGVRADVLLSRAKQIADDANRTPGDKTELHNLVEAARREIQLAEALGYGNRDDYKPVYAQLDDAEKKAESGQFGAGLFDRIEQSLKSFKLST